jgi:hypothetical protein
VLTELLTFINQEKTALFYEDCSNTTPMRNLLGEAELAVKNGCHVHQGRHQLIDYICKELPELLLGPLHRDRLDVF